MKIFLVAVMAIAYVDGTKDIYVWTDPIFENERECVDFVAFNNHYIYDHLTNIYDDNPLEAIYCATEQQVENIIGKNT